MRGFAPIGIAFLVVLANLSNVSAQTDIQQRSLPRIPGAVLVTGWPPGDLFLTKGDATSRLQMAETDWYVSASISRDGQLIASAHLAEEFPHGNRTRPRLKPSVYSTADKTWTFYNELSIYDGSVAISPDGSKLACITRLKAGEIGRISILDLHTKKIVPYEKTDSAFGYLSWSPDSRRIAFEKQSLVFHGEVFALNVENGSVAKLADGWGPSWSPSGEWIAFYDGNKLAEVRPDGRGRRTVLVAGKYLSNEAPVWSPNSKTILISKWHGDNNDWVDIYYVNLATNKMTKKFRKVEPIYAWLFAE